MVNLIQSVEHGAGYKGTHFGIGDCYAKSCVSNQYPRFSSNRSSDRRIAQLFPRRAGSCRWRRGVGRTPRTHRIGSTNQQQVCWNEDYRPGGKQNDRPCLFRGHQGSYCRTGRRRSGYQGDAQSLRVQLSESRTDKSNPKECCDVSSSRISGLYFPTVRPTVHRQFRQFQSVDSPPQLDTKSIEGNQVSVQFKENTGFCCRCRQWKLLVVVGRSDVSRYCIACDKQAKPTKFRHRADESRVPDGPFLAIHERRIAAVAKRVKAELAALEKRRRAS